MSDNNLTNPQAMVDAALSTPTDTVKTAEPVAPTSTQQMETLPPPPAPVAPVMPSPEPTITTQTTTTTSETTATTQPLNPPVVMGDDTPLAFASAPTMAAVPNDTTAANLTPFTGQTTSSNPVNASSKPKSKMGKILMGIFGFLMLGGLAFGGYWYYTNNYGDKGVVAEITTQSACNGCSPDGFQWKWHSATQKCSKSAIPCGDTSGDAGANYTTKAACEKNGAGNPGFWCAGCGGFCNTTNTKTCNQLQVEQCGEAVTYGASCSTTQGGKFTKGCDCDSTPGDDTWFDKTGVCSSKDATGTVDPSYYDTYGLCAVAKGGCPDGNATTGGNQPMYTCDNSGCSLTAAGIAAGGYTVEKWTCDRITNLSGGCQDGKPSVGNSQKFNATCGTQQIDVQHGGTLVDFRSRTNATACTTTTTTSPSPSPNAPVMACTGITKAPTTVPTIGSTVTFTCAGTITPTTAGTLSYKFRYSINNGAMTTLANTTATTAKLTIAACGDYKVECQTCATIAGVLKCDPTWTGATQ